MIPREEHPKPQFRRENWQNLNGIWDFQIDFSNSGREKDMFLPTAVYSKKITVPFCPQSDLSGVGEKDFMSSVWYKRTFVLSAKDVKQKNFLHIGACDYITTLYINGKEVGKHKGGYVSFKFDISDYVIEGENLIVINAVDDERSRLVPSGKQCEKYKSYGCCYTRTTGIWQTVWLETVPLTYIKSVRFYPSAEKSELMVQAEVEGNGELKIFSSFDGENTGSVSVYAKGGTVSVTLPLTKTHLWEVGKGGLYDLKMVFGEDVVYSYFGLRSISYRDKKFFLNGKSVFQRLILDQGFYPDGIYTASSDKELEADIDRSMSMGFNGARLHEKIFEERFLYHADKKGYMVWGEYPNWGLDHTYLDAIYSILPEWIEEVNRDFNHPSIVGWCPFNETADLKKRKQYDDLISTVYLATKAIDPSRPCIDTSGFVHVKGYTDIYDVHDYEQNPEKFNDHYKNLKVDGSYTDLNAGLGNIPCYDNVLPFFVSEYGGIRWSDKDGWGYGQGPTTEEEFISRLKGLTDAMLDNEGIFAFCYTQLTDVEQEQNGLYTYERRAKFPPEVIKAIISRKSVIED